MKPKIIYIKGQPHLVILSYKDYCAILNGHIGHTITPEIERLSAAREDETPAEVLRRLQNGESPLRAWRLYRDLTQTELARRSGVSTSAISQIENNIRPGTVETFNALAKVLKIRKQELTGLSDQKRNGRKTRK